MIYLDNNATTPLSERVKEAIVTHLDKYGNPSSIYKIGAQNKQCIDHARQSVATLINADAKNIIFTGCATESNNAVINSCVDLHPDKTTHIVTTKVEHSAILETVKYYQKYRNVDVTFLDVDSKGRINPNDLKAALRGDTTLVSVMLVNNEIGNIYDVKKLCSIVKEYNPTILFHTDATQAVGKMKVNVEDLNVDFLTLSGHKFYAPKGVGALYMRNSKLFLPYMHGGHQERGLRAGTENILSIVAMGTAADEAIAFTEYDRIAELRDYIENMVLKLVKPARVIGDIEHRICNTSCVLFEQYNGVDICDLINRLPEAERVCISSGSACNSIALAPSHVMEAMDIQRIPIRISLNKYTSKDELDTFLRSLMKIRKILGQKH